MPPPPPYLFDLDGTLADTLGDIAASTNHVRAHAGLPPLSRDGVRACIGKGAATLLRRALPELRLRDDDARWDDLLRTYVAHHDVQCTATATLYPGVRAELERLAQKGHPMAVVTNKPERFAVVVVRHLGLAPFLPVVIGGDTLPVKKPDPAPLREALRRLGVEGNGGSMVGDGETDLRAGRAMGLRTVACLYGYGDRESLLGLEPDAVWTRFGG